MVLFPVNALETYWDTYNPAPDIAGLTAVLSRLNALPNNLVSTNNQAKWARMFAELPPLPTGVNGGKPVLLAYTGPFPGNTAQTNSIRNGENTELYAVFPYRVYGLDKANLTLATNSYSKRLFKGLGWADWMQDSIQAALMGLTSEAKMYTVYAMTNKEPSLKFPAFWREQNDYEPSENNGAVAQDALQRMIMQTSGKKIMLQQAWPSGWNAIFKLNAPFNTVVQGMISNGLVSNLIVTPPSRMADVILMTGGGSLPVVPANLNAMNRNGSIALNWDVSSGAISYKVKRSTSDGGPYAVITNIFDANFIDASVIGGATYYYVVSAVNPSGESANSTQVNVTASVTIPAPPTGLAAVSGDGQVTLNWIASLRATNYNIKRSTVSGSGYVTVGSRTTTLFTDTGLSNGTTYYYVVTAQNSVGESDNSAQVNAIPTAAPVGPIFTSGTFANNSVLSLTGLPSQELFGVSLGGASSRVTANGYSFAGYPSTNLSYGGSGAYGFAGFLGGGGTSGVANFDAVLNNGQLGINSGNVILSNLTVGASYNVLFLEADTRGGVGSRSFSIGFGSGSVASAAQAYAYQGGSPNLGGYILCTFTATAATQVFTNQQGGFGYQLDGILVGKNQTGLFYININGVKTSNPTNIVFSGGTGPAQGAYRILASTNLASWIPVATDYFDSAGNFNFTNSVDPMIPATFYRLVVP